MRFAADLWQGEMRCLRSLLLACLPAVAILFSPIFTAAQSTGGQIRGTIMDPSGATVAAVTVTLVNQATGSQRTVQTGANGDYIFLEVPVGNYEIDVTQTGFKSFVRKGVALDLNQVISVDIKLELGSTAESVEVTGAPPVVDTSSTQLGAVVNERASTQLPLNQRDVYQLLQLQPGVQSQLGNDLFYGSDKAGVVTVNGGRGRSNNYSVNGGDGNDLFANLPAIQPSPDSIEEFRVISNSFDAEYGRNSGAVVNVVTKSGTNSIHGSFYEFFRNDVLNAHPFTFFQAPKPEFRQNQFGGTIGGPIKKDKTFFFGSYEGRRIVQGIVSEPINVPTGAEVNSGDFSAEQPFTGSLTDGTVANILQNRCGSGAPASLTASQKLTPAAQAAVATVAAGGSPVPYSQIFAGNQIPTGCFDPVAVSLLQYVPGAGGSGGVQITPNKTDRGDQFQIRVDHNFSAFQKTSIYYYFDDDNSLDPFAKFQASGATTGNFPGVYATRAQQINVTHTSTIGTTSVNEFRFSFFREGQLKFDTPTRTNAITASCGTGAAAAFCFTGTSDTPLVDDNGNSLGTNIDYGLHSGLGPMKEGVPLISVGGGFSIGNNFNGQLPQTGNTYQFSDNFSKIIGNHSLKFGADTRYQQFNQLLYFDINGDLSFVSDSNICGPANTNTTTCSPVSGNDLGASDAYPNYFLGLGNNFFQGSAQHELVRSTSIYLFAQDSWKLRPNATLNYGLRWEMNTPLTDIGKKVQTFRPGQNTTIFPCTLPTTSPLYVAGSVTTCDQAGVTPIGLVFPGDKGVPGGLTNTYYKGFAPRLGLNWSPGASGNWLARLTGGPSKTSISIGYGIFYNPIEQLVLEQFSAEPPFGGSNNIVNSLLQTPYVDQSGNVFPNPFNGILNPPRGSSVDWSQFRPMTFFGQFPPNLKMQYSDQYNLTIKRQLPHDILFQIGYVGSQGHRLLASYEANPGNPNTCNDLAALGQGCSSFGEDSAYSFVLPAGATFHLPYAPGGPNGTSVPCPVTNVPASCIVTGAAGGTPITLVGIRRYSSPLCNPLTGSGCPADGTPVFSGIFSEDTVARSNYNSLQVLLQKNISHGLQFQASYTFSKTMDNASSFESALNPLNFNSTYGLSDYDARHRFVVNYVWDLPVPKYDGFKGKLLNGWELSGIASFQSGFPIRITSQSDIEELDSTSLFEFPGEPNLTAPFHTQNIRQNNGFVFDPNLFTNNTVAPGTIGNAPRTICCGPGINNWDMSFMKETPLGEHFNMEFRADIFNIWNHAQFYSVDGNVSNQGSTFGQVLHVHDPRLVQFSLKFRF
ncbi:MAG TPA: carboxypeptidase regulatory-like domain-containing protein [Candidatus Acidoferrum sp.]|nr:carboxypeptidase regulatory-like domain-containing protein [Candidatus Acidoferrum sp.]